MTTKNDCRNFRAKDLYIAIILMKSSSPSPEYIPLYEELFVLIIADTLHNARQKAIAYGTNQETDYYNENKWFISLRMKKVIDVNPVLSDTIKDVTELYARHFKNFDAYRNFEALINQEDE